MGRRDPARLPPIRGKLMILRPIFAAAALASLAWAAPASAADAVFPPASHIGLVAPATMKPSQSFRGFEDRDASASILILEIPAQAYAGVEKQLSAEALKKDGVVEEKRENVTLKGAKGLLIAGTQENDNKKYRKW